MLKEKDWRKRQAGKENEFYTKVNNGGIIKKRMPDVAEIKQNIDAAQRRAEAYENEWLDSVFNNAGSRQVSAAKARAQEAKGSVKSWNEKLSEAYGLGENGYWNRSTGQPKTQQSAQMRANPAHAYAAGNGRPAQTASTTPAQPKTQQSAQMRTNPAHAYGIGQFGTKAEQPKSTIVPGAAGSAKGREIMQLQDTLVHNPGMSDREKNQVQEKISSLAAEKEVLDWKDANPGTPTVENYEAQKSYYDRLWQQNQDAIVNGLGNGTLEQGSDEWYALFKKGDDLLAMKDAYNRGMMGQVDGEKAQTAEEQAAAETRTGGGRRAGLDAKDEAAYTGGTKSGMDDGEEKGVSDDYYQGMLNAYGNIGEGITAEQDRKAQDTIEPYPWSPSEKDTEKQAALTELDDQMAEEIAAVNSLRQETYEMAYDDFDMTMALEGGVSVIKGAIKRVLHIDVDNLTDEELKEAYAEAMWMSSEAYDITTDKMIEDIITKYDGLRDEAEKKIDYKYDVLEKIGELDENPEISLIDLTSINSYDLNSDKSSELAAIDRQIQELNNYLADLVFMDKPGKYKEIESIKSDIAELERRKAGLIEESEHIEKIINADLADLNLEELTKRTEYEFADMLSTLEQDVINESLEWFNDALQKWQNGDDSDIRNIVMQTSKGNTYLENIEDFNELRNEYVKYMWESGIYDEVLVERMNELIYERIAPYFKEKVHYQETENGYKFEIPPNLAEYIIADAERKEQQQKEKGKIITIGSIMLGGVATIATAGAGALVALLIGSSISIGGAVWGDAVSDDKDEWDDIAGALRNHTITGDNISVEVIFGKDGEPEVFTSDIKE